MADLRRPASPGRSSIQPLLPLPVILLKRCDFLKTSVFRDRVESRHQWTSASCSTTIDLHQRRTAWHQVLQALSRWLFRTSVETAVWLARQLARFQNFPFPPTYRARISTVAPVRRFVRRAERLAVGPAEEQTQQLHEQRRPSVLFCTLALVAPSDHQLLEQVLLLSFTKAAASQSALTLNLKHGFKRIEISLDRVELHGIASMFQPDPRTWHLTKASIASDRVTVSIELATTLPSDASLLFGCLAGLLAKREAVPSYDRLECFGKHGTYLARILSYDVKPRAPHSLRNDRRESGAAATFLSAASRVENAWEKAYSLSQQKLLCGFFKQPSVLLPGLFNKSGRIDISLKDDDAATCLRPLQRRKNVAVRVRVQRRMLSLLEYLSRARREYRRQEDLLRIKRQREHLQETRILIDIKGLGSCLQSDSDEGSLDSCSVRSTSPNSDQSDISSSHDSEESSQDIDPTECNIPQDVVDDIIAQGNEEGSQSHQTNSQATNEFDDGCVVLIAPPGADDRRTPCGPAVDKPLPKCDLSWFKEPWSFSTDPANSEHKAWENDQKKQIQATHDARKVMGMLTSPEPATRPGLGVMYGRCDDNFEARDPLDSRAYAYNRHLRVDKKGKAHLSRDCSPAIGEALKVVLDLPLRSSLGQDFNESRSLASFEDLTYAIGWYYTRNSCSDQRDTRQEHQHEFFALQQLYDLWLEYISEVRDRREPAKTLSQWQLEVGRDRVGEEYWHEERYLRGEQRRKKHPQITKLALEFFSLVAGIKIHWSTQVKYTGPDLGLDALPRARKRFFEPLLYVSTFGLPIEIDPKANIESVEGGEKCIRDYFGRKCANVPDLHDTWIEDDPLMDGKIVSPKPRRQQHFNHAAQSGPVASLEAHAASTDANNVRSTRDKADHRGVPHEVLENARQRRNVMPLQMPMAPMEAIDPLRAGRSKPSALAPTAAERRSQAGGQGQQPRRNTHQQYRTSPWNKPQPVAPPIAPPGFGPNPGGMMPQQMAYFDSRKAVPYGHQFPAHMQGVANTGYPGQKPREPIGYRKPSNGSLSSVEDELF